MTETSTCTYMSEPPSINIDDIRKVVEMIKGLDWVASYMRGKGFDPAEGCIMVVPKDAWEEKGMPERPFIKKSEHAEHIILIRPECLPGWPVIEAKE